MTATVHIAAGDGRPIDENLIRQDYAERLARGALKGRTVIQKFGRANVGTAMTPVSWGGFYRTPTAAAVLEVLGAAQDTAAGSGAQEVTLIGLNENWKEVTQSVEMAGATAVTCTTPLTRLFRCYVSRSGTYGTQAGGGQAGDITIRESGGGDTWAILDDTAFDVGQSEIACYTVPSGRVATIHGISVSVDAAQDSDVIMLVRNNADDITTPFSGILRKQWGATGLNGPVEYNGILGPYTGPCDIMFMASVNAGTGIIEIAFEIHI